MSEFKPMVRMYTDEPSAILKLKKGGKVKRHKEKEEKKEHEGHKPMHLHAFESEEGKSPKKPSMAERMKAMNPMLKKKGGEVKKKSLGGIMPLGNSIQAVTPTQPMNQPNPIMNGRQGRAMMMQRKNGGSIDSDLTKTTVKGNAKAFEKTLVTSGDKIGKKHGRSGEIKEQDAGGYKRGGKVGKAETVGHNIGDKIPSFEVGQKKYRKGGTVGERVPSDTYEYKDNGKKIIGETIGDNEHDFLETQLHSACKDGKKRSSGKVDMGNAGGFKHGGKIMRKAEVGSARLGEDKDVERVDRKVTKNTVRGKDWENIPADTTPRGKTDTSTGEVKEANAGGFKHGGHAKKKAYAKGGNVIDDGRPEKIKNHFASPPVANTLQSGTFARGGKVEKEDKPNLRLLKTHTGSKGHVAKVYKDKDWGEYRTKFYSPEGKHMTESDHHTDDLDDAHSTAQHQLNNYRNGGKTK